MFGDGEPTGETARLCVPGGLTVFGLNGGLAAGDLGGLVGGGDVLGCVPVGITGPGLWLTCGLLVLLLLLLLLLLPPFPPPRLGDEGVGETIESTVIW